MAIYVFNLLTGYGPNGIDNAQGYRAQMLKNMSCSVKHVFTELPMIGEVNYYNQVGIDVEQMISAHQYFLDYSALNLSVRAEEKLEELRERLNCTEVEREEKRIRLKRQGMIVAELLLGENDRNYIHAIYYYNSGKLIRAEIYTDRIFYVNYYITAKSEHGLYAKLARRAFYNNDGSIAYNQIFEKEREYYLFEDGKTCTKAQFIKEFIVKLNLSEKDTVIVDRTAQFDFVQPLFQFGNKAHFIVVVHSEHYFEKGRDFNWSYQYFN